MSKTALLEAIRFLDLDETKGLLAAKPALIDVRDRIGRSLLLLACASAPARVAKSPADQVRLVDFLLDRGLAIDEPHGKDKVTPLFAAVARARNAALVKHLLKRGAKVLAAPGGGLFAAGWWEDLDILDILLEAGAEIEHVAGVTPFFACWGWGRFKAAKHLVLRGANVNSRDRKGRTALYVGVEKEYDPSLLTWLVRRGASPDVTTRDGDSARTKASRKRDKRFFAALSPKR